MTFLLTHWRSIGILVLIAIWSYGMMSIGELRVQARWDAEKQAQAEQLQKNQEKAHGVENRVRVMPTGAAYKQLLDSFSRD